VWCANSWVHEAGLNTASALFINQIVSSTTTIPPDDWDSRHSAGNPVGIVWIILLTVVIFAMGVSAIAALQKKCQEKADPFTYRAPRTISSIICPCLDSGERSRSVSMSRGNFYAKHTDDDMELTSASNRSNSENHY
jgi:hypothetical protein